MIENVRTTGAESSDVPETTTVLQAEMAIGVIRDEMAMMGANDMEIPTVNALIEDVRAGRILPAEAIRQAGKILAAKQDYH